MAKILRMLGATVGGALGWWLGARVGLFSAMFLSVLGTALGVYGAGRFARTYL